VKYGLAEDAKRANSLSPRRQMAHRGYLASHRSADMRVRTARPVTVLLKDVAPRTSHPKLMFKDSSRNNLSFASSSFVSVEGGTWFASSQHGGALLTGQDQAKKLRVVNRIFPVCSTNLPNLALLAASPPSTDGLRRPGRATSISHTAEGAISGV
jgi:hypothetical protein